MFNPSSVLILVLGTLVSLHGIAVITAADAATSSGTNLGLITIPSQAQVCSCSLSLSCSCCQSVVVNAVNTTKTLCLTFKISVLSGSVDVGVTMDGNSMTKFTISTTSPPTFCLPVLSLVTPLDMCLKLNIKMAGLSGIQACPTFYSSYDSSNVVSYDFPCIQLGLDGVSLV
ncbi:uncharacterized protein LOC113564884 [Drosophila persimilis]|uniref:uncharacterized protein LOC113564884 n=1 Tax=Drosophila persimilis TaxID=7234 RepID=UPI000F08916F|nr:uncharacterized protein LOC113564884 [Drosophila persimilis]